MKTPTIAGTQNTASSAGQPPPLPLQGIEATVPSIQRSSGPESERNAAAATRTLHGIPATKAASAKTIDASVKRTH